MCKLLKISVWCAKQLLILKLYDTVTIPEVLWCPLQNGFCCRTEEKQVQNHRPYLKFCFHWLSRCGSGAERCCKPRAAAINTIICDKLMLVPCNNKDLAITYKTTYGKGQDDFSFWSKTSLELSGRAEKENTNTVELPTVRNVLQYGLRNIICHGKGKCDQIRAFRWCSGAH